MTQAGGNFKDWAGQQIPYRLRATTAEEAVEAGEWITCEIDPQECDEWQVMGRGKSSTVAVSRAKAAWDAYDRSK